MMRKFFLNAMSSLCALAIALTPFFHFKGVSLVLFGEPPYPTDEK